MKQLRSKDWQFDAEDKSPSRLGQRKLATFISRFASYDSNLIVGMNYTNLDDMRRVVPFGSIGLPLLGSPEWFAIHADERDADGNTVRVRTPAENLQRHLDYTLGTVEQAIRDNLELYRTQLRDARIGAFVRRPVTKRSKENGAYQQNSTYRAISALALSLLSDANRMWECNGPVVPLRRALPSSRAEHFAKQRLEKWNAERQKIAAWGEAHCEAPPPALALSVTSQAGESTELVTWRAEYKGDNRYPCTKNYIVVCPTRGTDRKGFLGP